MARSGWHNESYRHVLAAKGVRTGRGFFAGKGNREAGELKRLLATPKRDAQGNIMYDPMTGRPVYPTKAELNVPYAPRPQGPSIADPVVRARLEQEVLGLQQQYAQKLPEYDVAYAPLGAQDVLRPEAVPQESMVENMSVPSTNIAFPQELPESQLRAVPPADISDDVNAVREAVIEYNGEKALPMTPSVPPEPTSILDDSRGLRE